MKYKIGDKVEEISKQNGHVFDIGEVVEIVDVRYDYYRCKNKTSSWYLIETEVKLA